jgi:hypothetical protein
MKETVTVWTCERCRAKDELPPSHQPLNWTGIVTFSPAESTEPEGKRGHLCRRCTRALIEFLSSPPIEDRNVAVSAS